MATAQTQRKASRSPAPGGPRTFDTVPASRVSMDDTPRTGHASAQADAGPDGPQALGNSIRESRGDLESMALSTLLREGGPVMPLILLTALAGYILAVERLLAWVGSWSRERPLLQAADTPALLALLRPLVHAASAAPAAQVVLLAALRLRDQPAAEREAALHPVLLEQMPRAEARISTIGWLGTILPMLGLLGTVSGMIATFRELAVTTSRQVLSQGLARR